MPRERTRQLTRKRPSSRLPVAASAGGAEGTSSRRTTRVLIVDDHPIVREGLATRIAKEPDLEVCGEAEDVPGALAALARTRPDLVIIDISLKRGNGIDLIKRIRDRDSHVRMLVSSMHEESLYAERALRAGAVGYINKQHSGRRMIEAIRCILEGKTFLSEPMTERVVGRAVGTHRPPGGLSVDVLADRELETFELIGQGLSSRQIAEKLKLTPKTIETYRERISRKLGISGRDLNRHAMRWVVDRSVS